ncbi:ABC transporter ATP-binding protein [Methylocystis sp. B8]|uniref:ABC transporter ATP-binding protein n=1 Tax=Methylocystis sp. B8 TaxID=544938 RepID=UPI001485831C|nr:ABC transporter ATP-binding protein [Methylocystis sp. B8]
MSSSAIEVRSISKQYDLGEGGSVLSFFRQTSEKFWALRDVSFEIREHEAVGVIGSNGAGKSTLLKILSRVTAPTQGRARIRGRMGTILEVGTGFHPELTGRENVYLSGTILGMRKCEIDRRFDEIVDFAGVERFIDTPVKRYSSGMYVRLAFAVAAHLDPDILIVDEVLAVGDVGFQKKCLAKMDSSINQDGRTIIFVSHNMQAIRSLCSRALLLHQGSLVADGPISEVLANYADRQQTSFDVRERSLNNRLNRTRGHARITALSVSSPGQAERRNWSFNTDDALELNISYEVVEPIESLDLVVSFSVAGNGDVVTSLRETVRSEPSMPGASGHIRIEIPKLPFRPGEFALTLGLGSNGFAVFEDILDANVNLPHLVIESLEDDLFRRNGLVSIDYNVHHTETRNLRSLAKA